MMSPSTILGIFYVVGFFIVGLSTAGKAPPRDGWVKKWFGNYFSAYGIIGLLTSGIVLLLLLWYDFEKYIS